MDGGKHCCYRNPSLICVHRLDLRQSALFELCGRKWTFNKIKFCSQRDIFSHSLLIFFYIVLNIFVHQIDGSCVAISLCVGLVLLLTANTALFAFHCHWRYQHQCISCLYKFYLKHNKTKQKTSGQHLCSSMTTVRSNATYQSSRPPVSPSSRLTLHPAFD